jgi:hypothetical protein
MAKIRLPHLARSAQSGLLDTFLVSAVLTILTIRVYLKAANYPQIGGGGLHVAHVLWGGLGMVIAIVLLLAFLGSFTQRLAAIVGGIGFGAFVDELGKFLTADNNYFFKPTAALIYTIFVALILATREIRRVRRLTPEENLVNAVELAKDLAMDRLSLPERERALALLAASDQANPLVAVLRAQFFAAQHTAEQPSWISAIAAAALRRYESLIANRWFRRVVAALFILQALALVLGALVAVAVGVALMAGFITTQSAFSGLAPGGPGDVVQTGASLVSGGLTVAGVMALRRNRLRAYRWFEMAVLVGLLLAQPFTLVDAGFGGLVEVFVDLALLVTLRFMIAQEHQLAARPAAATKR